VQSTKGVGEGLGQITIDVVSEIKAETESYDQ
jgi:hypothetical protein